MSTEVKRLDHWPRLLSDFIESRRHLPFSWGSNDCCLFACDAIKAITGFDPGADYRGRYDDALGAARILKEQGGCEGIAFAVCFANGWDEVDPRLAQRGDAVSCDLTGGHGPALGICIGVLSVFPGADGIMFMQTLQCRKAWRIP